MTPETLLNQLESLKSDRDNLLKSFKSIVQGACVEKFEEGDERPCDEHDFSVKKRIRESQIINIKLIFQNLVATGFFSGNEEAKTNHPNMDKELLALLLILCGENSSIAPWNNETIVMNCQAILSDLLKLFGFPDVTRLIFRSHKMNLIKDILQILCQKLSPTTWKHFPASVACYKWILEKIKQPELSSLLSMALPTALLLVDDFVNENKVIGISCLNHIVQNVTIAELQFYGHGDVIYNALLPLLRLREAEILSPTIPCLLYLTGKLEIDFGKKDVTKWSKFDNIMEIYLENMELESMIDLRNCYINNLDLLFSSSGNGIIRWTKRLLRIFSEYLEVAGKYNDPKTRNNCLKAIERFIDISKSLIPLYGKDLLYTLFIALISSTDSSIETENKEIAIRCIKKILESLSESDKEDLKLEIEREFHYDENYSDFYEKVCEVLQIQVS